MKYMILGWQMKGMLDKPARMSEIVVKQKTLGATIAKDAESGIAISATKNT